MRRFRKFEALEKDDGGTGGVETMFRRTFVVVVIVVLEIRETKDASRKFRRKIFIRRR